MSNDISIKPQSITDYLGSPAVQKNIENVLGERKAQFITSVASLVNSTEALQTVDRKSLFSACLTSASLDLPINPNLGFAYIIPYKNNKTGEVLAQFQMGYKGFIQLSMRSGQFKTINVTDVRDGEMVSNNRLSGEIEFKWIEDNRNSLPIVGFVSYMRLTNGFEKSLYMSVEDMTRHGVRYSKSMKKGYGLWKDDFEAMAKKTVLKLLLSKYAPMSTDMETATLVDQAVVTDEGYKYIDNEPINPTEIAVEKERQRVLKHINESNTLAQLNKVNSVIEEYGLTDQYNGKLDEIKTITEVK
jgi:recombination protein RecT